MPHISWNGNPVSLQGCVRIAHQDIRHPNDLRFVVNFIRPSFDVYLHIAGSSEGHHALMTVGVALESSVRTGTQNENPTWLNRRGQSMTERIEGDRLQGHERVRFSCQLGADSLYDRLQLPAHLVATDNFIQRLED